MWIAATPVAPILEEPVFERPDGDQRHNHQHSGEDRDAEETEPNRHAERRHHPDRRSSRQAANVFALAEYRPSTEESDARHNLRSYAGRVDTRSEYRLEAERAEHARTDRNEGHRPNAGRVAAPFSLGAEQQTNGKSNDYAKPELEVALNLQVSGARC